MSMWQRPQQITIWLLLLAGLVANIRPACGQAYCNIKEITVNTLSNGIQIQVKADGILAWGWAPGSERAGYGQEITEAAVRFPEARLVLDKTLYNVDQEPVSTVSLSVPQDAKDGRGAIMTVAMSQQSKVQASLSEDRQTFLLTVLGTRTVERTPRGPGGFNGPGGSPREGTIDITAKDGLISVKAVKANIHQVVAEIAEKSGLSVAVDDAVRHDVSLNMQDRQPLEVIRGIAAGYGLALSSVGDVYMLSEGVPTDLSSYRRSGTTSFPMRYLKASDAKSLLPTFLFKYVHDNPEQNAVVVTAPSQMLEKINRDMQAIDVPPPMIMIECAVVELTDSRDLDTQFRWQYQSGQFDFGTNSGTGDISYRQLDLDDGLSTAISATPKLQVWLQALLTKGRAEVQAHPSMAAVNGKYAEIFIGSQRFVKMQYTLNGQLQDRIETVPVGVTLQIRPWTGGNQEITTWLKARVSNIVQIDPETGIPRLGIREASTTMRTRDGDTIVIGGLSQHQDEQTARRIPFFGSLPLIGPLFRSKATGENNTELVILVRPRLLDASGRLPVSEDTLLRNRYLQPGDPGYPGEKLPKPDPDSPVE